MGNMDFSIFSARSTDTERLKPIIEHPYRDKFQRDRDRILYSKEFRRLSGKTQVFVTSLDDNVRTRLTHTLEVQQIANTISSCLNLNTTLTDAIAYGHDVGHTPFGHIGERTLNYIMNGCFDYYGYKNVLDTDDVKGFKHNLQGVRVVTKLENEFEEEPGLNLTRYTLWGIANHTKKSYNNCDYLQSKLNSCGYKNLQTKCMGELSVKFYETTLVFNEKPVIDDKRDWTFEGLVVAYADEIAQRHHDIEDGIYAGIIDIKDLLEYIKNTFSASELSIDCDALLEEELTRSQAIKKISKLIVDYYTTKFIDALSQLLVEIKSGFGTGKNIENADQFFERKREVFEYIYRDGNRIETILNLKDNFYASDKLFAEYLKSHILLSELAQSMDGKASYIIRKLVKAYLTNPQQLPDKTIISIIYESYPGMLNLLKPEATQASTARKALDDKLKEGDKNIKRILLRRICDFIAGMTDNYAMKQYKKLYEVHDIIR